jgi:hypothetical protein
MKQFSGGDEYWQAFQRSWLRNQPSEPGPEPEYEPVHGWTTRQLADYLARNPGYRSTYANLRNGSNGLPVGQEKSKKDKASNRIGPETQ